MARYRAQITITFDTEKNVPDVSFSGSMTEANELVGGLSVMDDIDEDLVQATVRLEAIA